MQASYIQCRPYIQHTVALCVSKSLFTRLQYQFSPTFMIYVNKFTSNFWHVCTPKDSFFNGNAHDINVTLQPNHLHIVHTCRINIYMHTQYRWQTGWIKMSIYHIQVHPLALEVQSTVPNVVSVQSICRGPGAKYFKKIFQSCITDHLPYNTGCLIIVAKIYHYTLIGWNQQWTDVDCLCVGTCMCSAS